MKTILLLFISSLIVNSVICQEKEIERKSSSAEIVITSVKIEDTPRGKEATIEINGGMKISEIKVNKKEDRLEIKFPVYISRSGREYPQVKIISKEAYDKINKAIKSGEPEKTENIPPLKYEVSKMFPLRSATRKANVEVVFNKAIVVTCGVMVSKFAEGEYWIAWPARKDEEFGRYISQVKFKDKEFKKKIEKDIIAKYKRFKEELEREEEY